jgi:hypothetical protein
MMAQIAGEVITARAALGLLEREHCLGVAMLGRPSIKQASDFL